MAKQRKEVKRVYERAGAIGELLVFRFMGGKFGIACETIYQDFGGRRQWVECPNEKVRHFAIETGLL